MAGQYCDEAHADDCEPQEVWIGLRCHADTPLVGRNGTVLRLIMRLSWRMSRQICVDMASITAKTMQAGSEACIRSPKCRWLLDPKSERD